jgi:ribokinase
MNATQVIVVGSCNRDYAWRCERFPRPGETRRALDFFSGAGGKGYNQAVACRRQEVATCLIAALGEDAAAELTQRNAAQERLDARWQIVPGARSGSACVIIDAQGQNQIVVDLAANERLEAAHVHAQRQAFSSARAVLTQLECDLAPVRAALALARSHGALALLNPAPVSPELDVALLAACDVLIPNESEFAILLQRCAGLDIAADRLATLADAELAALAAHLPAPSVVITLGSAGCFVAHHGSDWHGDAASSYRVASAPARVLDSTGAGDTFCGALAAAYARRPEAPFAICIAHANRCAALSTERRGAAAAAPSWSEVVRRYGNALA